MVSGGRVAVSSLMRGCCWWLLLWKGLIYRPCPKPLPRHRFLVAQATSRAHVDPCVDEMGGMEEHVGGEWAWLGGLVFSERTFLGNR